MPRNINEHLFSPRIQLELLALLLHDPGLYRKYAECWRTKFVDELEAHEILHHWLMINNTGQVPGRFALEYSLTSNPTPHTANDPKAVPAVLKMLDAIFNLFPENDRFLLQQLEKHATDCNMYEVTGAALSAFEAGNYGQAVTALNRGLATGSRAIKLAEDEWYESMPVLSKEVIPGILRRGKVGMINGHPKSYKSWTLLHLSIAAATGRAWWFGALPPIRVLYVNMELDAEELKLRVVN